MVKSKQDIKSLCGKAVTYMTDYDKRLIMFNYIYHTKGVQTPDIFNARITDQKTFLKNLIIAMRYYQTL